jgi:Domain of unknown function (DUF3817)
VNGSWQPLRIAAVVELCSLIVLFLNLFTVHWPAVSSVVGPTHGCAYLVVVIATARHAEATRRMKATAVIPGIGGLLVVRQLALTRRDADEHQTFR